MVPPPCLVLLPQSVRVDPNPTSNPDPDLNQVVLRLLPQSEWKLAAKRGEKLGDQATPTLVILTPYS